MTNFNETLKSYRKLKKITQAELGKKVGVSSQVVSNWERGYTTGMSADMINKIADALGVDAAYLLGVSKSYDGSNDWNDYFYNDEFQMRIRSIMKSKSITIDELKEKSGIPKQRIDSYIYSNAQPIAEDLIRISNVLGTSIDYLLDNSQRDRLSTQEELMLSLFDSCDDKCKEYLIAKAGVLSVEGLSAIAGAEAGHYIDTGKKSSPSSGTGGKTQKIG